MSRHSLLPGALCCLLLCPFFVPLRAAVAVVAGCVRWRCVCLCVVRPALRLRMRVCLRRVSSLLLSAHERRCPSAESGAGGGKVAEAIVYQLELVTGMAGGEGARGAHLSLGGLFACQFVCCFCLPAAAAAPAGVLFFPPLVGCDACFVSAVDPHPCPGSADPVRFCFWLAAGESKEGKAQEQQQLGGKEKHYATVYKGTELSFLTQNLQPGTEYGFRVQAGRRHFASFFRLFWLLLRRQSCIVACCRLRCVCALLASAFSAVRHI